MISKTSDVITQSPYILRPWINAIWVWLMSWSIMERSLEIRTLATNLWIQPNREIGQNLLRDDGPFTFRMRAIKDSENRWSNSASSNNPSKSPIKSLSNTSQKDQANLNGKQFGPKALSPSTFLSNWRISSSVNRDSKDADWALSKEGNLVDQSKIWDPGD